MIDARKLWKPAVGRVETVEGLMFNLVSQKVTKGFLAVWQSHRENFLVLDASDEPFLICLINTVHANATSDDLISSTVLNLIEQIDAPSAKKEIYILGTGSSTMIWNAEDS
ncbi:hypothetical protein BCON_0038g00300 [Botryotinia convoluta]|uniref:Uncharacterized protein n=1 Tax=Botryotinia convoluta TaxID=54673 RepID=A0A4Z1IFI0_9HELO|nr:hypothetical protein BCON_0038g00300 [Botryotinia convoluta]